MTEIDWNDYVGMSPEDRTRKLDEQFAKDWDAMMERSMYPPAENRDGISWADAPMPFIFHRCAVQTDGWIGFTQVQRCACGAMRTNRSIRPRWHDKNERASAPVRWLGKVLPSLLAAMAIALGVWLEDSTGEWLVFVGGIWALILICRAVVAKVMDP